MRITRIAFGIVICATLWAIGLSPATAAPSTNLLGNAKPQNESWSDSDPITVGLRLEVKQSGTISAIRFYKGSQTNGTFVGAIYSSSGSRLAQATFPALSGSGWREMAFPQPVEVQRGQTVTAAVFMPRGRYAASPNFSWPVETDALRGTAGVYRYGSALTFPDRVHRATNYFIDVSHSSSSTPIPTPSATPTKTPTPTPTSSPTASTTSAPSSPTGFPSAKSTGVPSGTTLTKYTGPTVIKTDGTVIDSKQVTGCLDIRANNVTIKNSLLQARCFFNVLSDSGKTGLILSDVEIDGLDNTDSDSAINGSNFTCIRCNIHSTVDGIKPGSNVTIRDSYIHDLTMTSDSHNDGIQSLGTTSLSILNNSIVIGKGSTSAIILSTGSASNMRNIKIDGNLLGGGAYTVYGGYKSGIDSLSKIGNISVTNNKFTTQTYPKSGAYGPLTSVDAPVVVSGNTWYDGPNAGQAVRW